MFFQVRRKRHNSSLPPSLSPSLPRYICLSVDSVHALCLCSGVSPFFINTRLLLSLSPPPPPPIISQTLLLQLLPFSLNGLTDRQTDRSTEDGRTEECYSFAFKSFSLDSLTRTHSSIHSLSKPVIRNHITIVACMFDQMEMPLFLALPLCLVLVPCSWQRQMLGDSSKNEVSETNGKKKE